MNKNNPKAQLLSTTDKILQEKFAQDITNQTKLMDDIAKIFITIELSTPSIYAIAIKLSLGSQHILSNDNSIIWAFGFWFLSLVFTFLAIFPKKYKVNINRLDEIENFYFNSAKTKMHYLVISAILFCIGIAYSISILIKEVT
jgi:hypothetical protein